MSPLERRHELVRELRRLDPQNPWLCYFRDVPDAPAWRSSSSSSSPTWPARLAASCLLFLALFVIATPARAGLVTEIGGGIKLHESRVLSPECDHAVPFGAGVGHPLTDNEGRTFVTVPCGGSNPVFIGWPLAWDFNDGRTRVGWFHQSNWLDGPPFNHRSEVFFNCICATHTFRWTK